MYKRVLYYSGLLLLLLGVNPTYAVTEDSVNRVRVLLGKVDDLWRGQSSYTITSMHVKTEHYERTMKMEGWSKGKEKTLFQIMLPLREKGTSTLK